MPTEILWLEDDPSLPLEYFKMKPDRFNITWIETLTEAGNCLKTKRYDLLILDVLIPTRDSEEEAEWNPFVTDKGRRTGLAFYLRWKDHLESVGTKVFVFTIVGYQDLLDAFVEAGLPADCFSTKFTLERPSWFWDRIGQILSPHT